MPSTSKIAPAESASEMTVWTASLISSRRPAPTRLAITTFAPTDSPTNRLTNREITEELLPTAAIASALAKRPITARSAALNSCCSTLLAASGSANRTIFPANGP